MTATTRHTRFYPFNRVSMCILSLIAVSAAPHCLADGWTLWEGNVGPFHSRVVVWDSTELTEQNLRRFYHQLSRELEGSLAWTVEIFIDKDDAGRELHGKLATEGDYEWWLDLYNKYGRRLLPMAEMSSYQNNAVLRWRDSSGVCSEIVLEGENFLRVNADGVGFEILKSYYRSLPPHTKARPGDEAMITIYARTSPFPSVDQARTFMLLMKKRFRQERIIAVLRTDAFFLTDSMFPIVYRFDREITPPTREQYEQSKHMFCSLDRERVVCR